MKNEYENLEDQYTPVQLVMAQMHDNILDDFDDLVTKIDLFAMFDLREMSSEAQHATYLYVESLKDYVRMIEFKHKKMISEKTS